jgi:hypothetical protein
MKPATTAMWEPAMLNNLPTSREAAAPLARRFRRMKIVIVFLWGVLLLAFVIPLDKLGLFSSKFGQLLYGLVFLGSTIFWGLWKRSVPCPRCGWNIYMKPNSMFLALEIPSACPNCGLDLERPYAGDDDAVSTSAMSRVTVTPYILPAIVGTGRVTRARCAT